MRADNAIRLAWQKRSKLYGKKPEGVLPKSLPALVNDYLDNWMYRQIKNVVPRNAKVLDLGCGYGRLSKKVLHDFPSSQTFGVDIAKNYVDLYNRDLNPRGKAQVGDIRNLHFKDNFFDVVFMVTTLMYVVNKNDQKKTLGEIFRVLKPEGRFIIIEPNSIGKSIVGMGGLVKKIRGEKRQEINAVSFLKRNLETLVVNSGGVIDDERGLPAWTLFLPISMILSFFSGILCKTFLKFVGMLDCGFSWLLTPSLYISYSGVKNRLDKK